MKCPRCQCGNCPGAKFREEWAAPLARRCGNCRVELGQACTPRSRGTRGVGGVAMTEATVPSKLELLEALRSSRDHVLATVSRQSPQALEEGRYENGWNGRQILAHVASIEWTYPRLIEMAREAPSVPAGEAPTRDMRGGNDAYNERQVAKRAHLSTAALLEEFERNRAATIRAVEATEEEVFSRRIRSAGGVIGPLAAVLYQVAVNHVLGHVRDVVGPPSTAR